MRRVLLRSGLAFLGFVVAVTGMQRPGNADVTGTPHDLSTTAPGGQLCIACHVSHTAGSSELAWNHVLSASTFTWGDATQSLGGTTLPTNIKTWSGSSKACLSCHDGTVEIGKTYNPATTWEAAKISGSARIGPDLSGNHPVAVPYPNNGIKNTYNGITTGDLVVPTSYVTNPSKVKLYRDSAGGANNYGIECASCHDPHGTAYPSFLRDSMTQSGLCNNCHLN
jgi:predicted CXXCH cytochrome family protein